MVEKLSFQADISELMNLIIHAFYSNRDVFLREIVSNASDALDKQRHLDLQNNLLDQVYRIRLSSTPEKGLLVLEDTGVGMSRDDLVENLSTIARSGTKQFIQNMKQKSEQIGQFGVGFYSVFLVADQVDVWTQKKDHGVYKWSSDAQQFYTLEEVTDGSVVFEQGHGTRLVLTLKEDAREYLEEASVRRIISTHSSFITYPIELWVTKEVPVQKPEDGTEEIEEEEITEEGDQPVVQEINEKENVAPSEEKEKEKEPETVKVQEWEVVNGDKPVWYQASSEVAPEDYNALYKTISKDYDEPLCYRHFQTEGAFEFRGILYIPKRASFDVLGDRQKEKRRIRLYVKKVLVLSELDKEMLPDWMNFVVGVIDSSDLPLNVSREMLQQTKVLKAMKTQLKKQILTMLTELSEDKEKFKTFYEAFQRHLKLGIHEGDDSLLRFIHVDQTAGEGTITLDEYAQGCKEDQKCIYYATGPDAENNTFTKLYVSKGYNVLLFKEPIDEFMLQRVDKFKDFDMINIQKEHQVPWNTDISDQREEFCKWVKETIDDGGLETCRLSSTLVNPEDVPCCVVSSKFGWTGNMEKIMMSQPLNDGKSMFWMKGKKVLELNDNHPLVKTYLEAFEQKNTDPSLVMQLKLLYQSALLAAGFPLENAHGFLNNVVQCLYPSVKTTDTTTSPSLAAEPSHLQD